MTFFLQNFLSCPFSLVSTTKFHIRNSLHSTPVLLNILSLILLFFRPLLSHISNFLPFTHTLPYFLSLILQLYFPVSSHIPKYPLLIYSSVLLFSQARLYTSFSTFFLLACPTFQTTSLIFYSPFLRLTSQSVSLFLPSFLSHSSFAIPLFYALPYSSYF